MNMWTLKEVAPSLGLTIQGAHSAIRRGTLKAVKRGRDYLLSDEDVSEFLSERRRPGRPRRRLVAEDRFRQGVLPEALKALCQKLSAADSLARALAEDRTNPFHDSRERALLAACLREQVRHYGWESLASKWWDRMEALMEDPDGTARSQVAQSVKYIRLQRGEITPSEAASAFLVP